MILELGDDASEYGRQALRAFEAAGGDALVQKAQAQPESREALVAPVLDALGAWDLDTLTDADDAEAAAALCRSAGYWALPYPLAERLVRPSGLDADGLIVVDASAPEAAVTGVDRRWAAVTLDGECGAASAAGAAGPGLTTALRINRSGTAATADTPATAIALALVLPCWTLLGMLDRAIELTIAHIGMRHQFGQPLSAFQGVQFQLTEAEVERSGVQMLAKHALWSVAVAPDPVADALALRMAACEAAEVVFRISHQLHGAIGFCDETTLSWLSRYSQPLRRLPFGISATRAKLTERIGRHGLSGLFS